MDTHLQLTSDDEDFQVEGESVHRLTGEQPFGGGRCEAFQSGLRVAQRTDEEDASEEAERPSEIVASDEHGEEFGRNSIARVLVNAARDSDIGTVIERGEDPIHVLDRVGQIVVDEDAVRAARLVHGAADTEPLAAVGVVREDVHSFAARFGGKAADDLQRFIFGVIVDDQELRAFRASVDPGQRGPQVRLDGAGAVVDRDDQADRCVDVRAHDRPSGAGGRRAILPK